MPSKSRWINWIWGVKSEFSLTNIKPVNFNPLPVCQSTEVDSWGLNCESSCWSFLHSHFLPLQCLTVRVGLDSGFNDTCMGSSSWTVKKQLEWVLHHFQKSATNLFLFDWYTLWQRFIQMVTPWPVWFERQFGPDHGNLGKSGDVHHWHLSRPAWWPPRLASPYGQLIQSCHRSAMGQHHCSCDLLFWWFS